MLEVEQKYRVADLDVVRRQLDQLRFFKERTETHIDIYLRHPSRDFAVSGEAFRLRQIDRELFVTYKGKRHEGQVKIRPEIELPIGGDVQHWIELYSNLGFSIADEVRKTREVYSAGSNLELSVAVDSVQQLGGFVEIEVLVGNDSGKESAVTRVESLAERLGLTQIETRSYLRQILELKGKS